MERGDLEGRLIAAGVELLAEAGTDALSLREIARRAGVSHGAPRRYFPTHQALLAAIAREGYRELGRLVAETLGEHPAVTDNAAGEHTPAEQEHTPAEHEHTPAEHERTTAGQHRGAGERRLEPRDALLALARRYLSFAREQPGMFALMFRHDLLRGNDIGLRDESTPLFGVLVKLLTQARLARPTAGAAALWAALHGIAQLWHWGTLQVVTGLDDPEPLLVAAVDAHLGA